MRSFRKQAAVFAATVSVFVLAGAAAPVPWLVSGVTYVIHATTIGQTAMMARDTAWTAHVAWGGMRGRMDIVDGGQAPLFAMGDYVLFDSTSYIVVHPASKTFSVPPDFSGPNAPGGLGALGNAMKISNLKVALDTLEKGSVVSGHRTSHYRMRSSYTLTVDLSAFGAPPDAATPATTMETSSDFWFADDLDAAPNPFGVSTRSTPGPGPAFMSWMEELWDRAREMQEAMPSRHLVVRTTTVTKINAMGSDMSTQATTEIRDYMRADVDVARLVLPADYTQAAMAGLEAFGPPTPLAPAALAKWRAVPKA